MIFSPLIFFRNKGLGNRGRTGYSVALGTGPLVTIGYSVALALGRLGTRSPGHLVAWALGRLGTQLQGHSVAWALGRWALSGPTNISTCPSASITSHLTFLAHEYPS
jgi:hypothetical protein